MRRLRRFAASVASAGIFLIGVWHHALNAIGLDKLSRQKADIIARMAEAPADMPDVHGDVVANCSRNVARFADARNDPDGGRESADALHSFIGEMIVMPGEKRGELHATICGEWMDVLGVGAAQPEQGRTGSVTPLAAGPRDHFQYGRMIVFI